MTDSMLICIPHSPIIQIQPAPPPEEPEIRAHLARCAAAVERFAPDQIIMFGPDHYAGFHLALMPTYCIGSAASAVDDVGGQPGPLAVPADDALALIRHLRDEGFDPALSRRMTVDHGFSQPLARLFGPNDRYPVIPVFIDAMTPPFVQFARTRQFGAAVGRFAARSGKRTVFLGSGGMSHHPVRYYPLVGTGSAAESAWQLGGPEGGSFTKDEWFTRLRVMHEEGATMLASGARSATDIRLNEGFDRDFLTRTARGDLAGFDRLEPEAMIENSGVGSLELQNWVAAAAAHFAAGGQPATTTFYAPTIAYGVGYGVIY